MAKDAKTASAPPGAATPDSRPLWKRALGIGKTTDGAKASGTSPPAGGNGKAVAVTPAASTAAATVPPPEVDLSGFNPDGLAEAAPPPPKAAPSSGKLPKRATVALSLAIGHYKALCGIIFYTEDFAAMPGLINEYFDSVKGLKEPERQALWQLIAGMLWRHVSIKFAAPAGADEAARKAARGQREEAIAKFLNAFCEADPLSPPSAEDLHAFQSALYGAIGQAVMHDALKAPASLTKPAAPETDADGTGEFRIAGEGTHGGTPIMPEGKPAAPKPPAKPAAKPPTKGPDDSGDPIPMPKNDDEDGGPKVPKTGGGGGKGPKPLAAAAKPPAAAATAAPARAKPGEGETIGLAKP